MVSPVGHLSILPNHPSDTRNLSLSEFKFRVKAVHKALNPFCEETLSPKSTYFILLSEYHNGTSSFLNSV